MSVGFLGYLFMNDFFTRVFVCCCCNLVTFYDWRQCVMSVLGNYKIFLVQLYWHLAIKLYRIVMRCIGMWGVSSAMISSLHNRNGDKSSEDDVWLPILEGGCCYERSLWWLKTVPTYLCSALQYGTTLLPSVNTVELGIFCSCQVHSSHIHTNHKTSLNYNNSKQTSG